MDKKNKTYSQSNNHKESTPKNHHSINLLKSEFVGKENRNKLIFFLGIFAVAPIALLAGLLVVYFYHYPHTHDNSVFKVSGDNIAPFVITMVLICIIIAFAIYIFYALRRRAVFDDKKKTWTLVGIGIFASFTDTIGVGSYAVTMGLMKATKTNDDDSKFSGTMTVGYCLPQLIEATILSTGNPYEWETLLVLTACAVIGGLIGSWISKYINSQVFRFVISILMFIVGIIMILNNGNVNVIPRNDKGSIGFIIGADKNIGKIIGCVFIFIVLGILSTLGLGIYAPALAALSLMGMKMQAVSAIMSVAAAAMMPPAAIKFIKDKNFLDIHSAIFNMVGAIGCIASFLVFYVGLEDGANMSSEAFSNVLNWIAIVVVFYCSGLMMFSFVQDYKKTGWKQPKTDPDIL